MKRTLTRAGLLIDSWRDQSSQTEPSGIELPDGATAGNQLRDTSGDVPSVPRLMSLIALGTIEWKSP